MWHALVRVRLAALSGPSADHPLPRLELRREGPIDAPLARHGTDSDADLLTSLDSGTAEAMSALYDRYQARVYGAALAVCSDEDRAAEACLQTFLWMQGQAARLSRCSPAMIGQAIELQAVALCRRRAVP